MCPFAAVHKPLSFVQRCEDLGVPRPLTAILLPFFLPSIPCRVGGWSEKNCAASSPRSLLWLSSLLLLCVVGNAPKQPCGSSRLYHHENRCESRVTPLRRRQLERRISTCALTNKLERARSLFPCSCFYDAACRLSSAPDAEAPAVAVSLFVVLCVAWLERLSRGARRSISPRSPGYFATSRALTKK